MARPKRLKNGKKLNLLIEFQTKRAATKLAFERKISVGRLFEILIDAELASEAAK